MALRMKPITMGQTEPHPGTGGLIIRGKWTNPAHRRQSIHQRCTSSGRACHPSGILRLPPPSSSSPVGVRGDGQRNGPAARVPAMTRTGHDSQPDSMPVFSLSVSVAAKIRLRDLANGRANDTPRANDKRNVGHAGMGWQTILRAGEHCHAPAWTKSPHVGSSSLVTQATATRGPRRGLPTIRAAGLDLLTQWCQRSSTPRLGRGRHWGAGRGVMDCPLCLLPSWTWVQAMVACASQRGVPTPFVLL